MVRIIITVYISYLVSTLVDIISSAPILPFFGLILASAVIRLVINFVYLNFKNLEV